MIGTYYKFEDIDGNKFGAVSLHGPQYAFNVLAETRGMKQAKMLFEYSVEFAQIKDTGLNRRISRRLPIGPKKPAPRLMTRMTRLTDDL